jgi:HTH-type transcriptional regulator/antitoxin HigA
MDVRPIRCEADYDWALAEIAPYFERPPATGTSDADRFDVLAALIEAYEARAWPIPPLDPVDTIRHVMNERGFTQSDLAAVLGSRSRASEVLARRRPLSIAMIQGLRREWGIPAEALLDSNRDAA